MWGNHNPWAKIQSWAHATTVAPIWSCFIANTLSLCCVTLSKDTMWELYFDTLLFCRTYCRSLSTVRCHIAVVALSRAQLWPNMVRIYEAPRVYICIGKVLPISRYWPALSPLHMDICVQSTKHILYSVQCTVYKYTVQYTM